MPLWVGLRQFRSLIIGFPTGKLLKWVQSAQTSGVWDLLIFPVPQAGFHIGAFFWGIHMLSLLSPLGKDHCCVLRISAKLMTEAWP